MNSDEIQKHAIVSDSLLSLCWSCTCFTTGSILWPYSSSLGFVAKSPNSEVWWLVFFLIKLVERPFRANFMSMAITYMFTDYGSNPILVSVFAHS